MDITDNGANPYVDNIETLTVSNETFRTALWTGEYLQITLMSIPVGGEVGLEVHNDTDQFLRIEQGRAKIEMGPAAEILDQVWDASDDWAIVVPSGTWHNIRNTGDVPLKLYSIYAPAHHPKGTVHQTMQDSIDAEADKI